MRSGDVVATKKYWKNDNKNEWGEAEPVGPLSYLRDKPRPARWLSRASWRVVSCITKLKISFELEILHHNIFLQTRDSRASLFSLETFPPFRAESLQTVYKEHFICANHVYFMLHLFTYVVNIFSHLVVLHWEKKKVLEDLFVEYIRWFAEINSISHKYLSSQYIRSASANFFDGSGNFPQRGTYRLHLIFTKLRFLHT